MRKMRKNERSYRKFILFVIIFLALGTLVLFIQYMLSGGIDDSIVSQAAWDQFSIGHFVMGALICAFSLIFFNIYYGKKMDLNTILILSFMFTLVVCIGVELLENSDFFVNYSGLKYNNRADSIINITSDLVLSSLGSVLLCYVYWFFFKNSKRETYKGNIK